MHRRKIIHVYGANGNKLSGDGRNIGHTSSFLYGPNRSRFKRTDTKAGQTTTTLYVGKVEHITKPDGVVETKRYIGSKNIVTTYSNSSLVKELTVFTDHIGSTYALVNRDTGGTLQGMSFDAFGLRRNDNWSDMSLTQRLGFDHSESSKGFTGHEQLDEVGLIHMNGRLYDPLLVRFIFG